ncbi:hypothetical protein VTK26DRAFT_7015 [Humicola hyalothermophila]
MLCIMVGMKWGLIFFLFFLGNSYCLWFCYIPPLEENRAVLESLRPYENPTFPTCPPHYINARFTGTRAPGLTLLESESHDFHLPFHHPLTLVFFGLVKPGTLREFTGARTYLFPRRVCMLGLPSARGDDRDGIIVPAPSKGGRGCCSAA